MVHFSFYIKLKGPSIAKLDIYFPCYGLGVIFKGPWIFMDMALNMCVIVELMLLMYSELSQGK